MKVLYLPIIESGTIHATAALNKRGLYDALVAHGCEVHELDYLNTPQLWETLSIYVRDYAPDLLLTQLHGHEPITPDMLRRLREQRPEMRVVNWSGDSWRHSLVGEAYLPLVRQFDLQLVAAPDILPEYEALGIRAAFWQIAYEQPVGDVPEMPAYDVVFLGNVISEPRRAMLEMLRDLDDLRIGIYGDWQYSDGNTLYDFAAGESLYKRAKVAIADNVYPDQRNYVSNRPIQILMAGGATLLHQHVPKMDTLLGIRPGRHYVEWSNLDDLRFKARYWCNQYGNAIQRRMVTEGREYAQRQHTYAARVDQLMGELLPMIEGERV